MGHAKAVISESSNYPEVNEDREVWGACPLCGARAYYIYDADGLNPTNEWTMVCKDGCGAEFDVIQNDWYKLTAEEMNRKSKEGYGPV